jgi:predicted ferric reductase
LGKFLVPRYKFEIHQINKLSNNIVSIVLKPIGEKMNFTAGQFGFIRILGKMINDEEHPFSFTSDPNLEELSLAIKQVGDYTQKLDKLEIGTQVEVEGPFGIFSYKNSKNTNQIWLAGGIGITPFLSMLWDIKNKSNYRIDLYYCVKNESEAVFLNQITDIAKTVRVIPFYSDKEGHISAKEIAKRSNGLENKDIFICDPPAMIKDLRKQFISLGVNQNSIKSEEFDL